MGDARQTLTKARDQPLHSTDSNLENTIPKQGGMEQKRAFELRPPTFLATVSLCEVYARFVFSMLIRLHVQYLAAILK